VSHEQWKREKLRYDNVKQWRTLTANGKKCGKNFASFR